MNTSFANTNDSMFGAGIDFSAASDSSTATAVRTLGIFSAGLALTALLAGLLGR